MDLLRRQLHGLVCLLLLNLLSTTTLLIQCEGRSLRQSKVYLQKVQAVKHQESHQMNALNHLDTHYATSDSYDYIGSPFSLPPYDDVMGPSSSPQDYPPFCVYPPLTPLPPSTTPTTPVPFIQPPPPPAESINPPVLTPTPPEIPVPSPPENIPSPPEVIPSPPEAVPNPPEVVPNPPEFVPSPPGYEPSPPIYVPTPTGFVPSPPPPSSLQPPSIVPSPSGFPPNPSGFVPGPPIFLPPVVYPPPIAPPPPPEGQGALWCVAKPTVPDPIIQEAMNYACGSGADCDSIQPNGSCYQPDTLIAHASFAFNSYWQRTKVAGGTCDFGGTAMLVTKDPSYDGCHFIIY